MAHPQHAIPVVLADGEIRPGGARAGPRAIELGAVRLLEHDLFDERRHTVLRGVARERPRRLEHRRRGCKREWRRFSSSLAIPFLGALSDARRRRKSWVVGFTVLSCAALAVMGYLGQTLLPLTGESVDAPVSLPTGWHASGMPLVGVLAAFVVAMFAYQAAQPFYNAMMPELAPPAEQGRLSGFGTAVGYIGSIVGVLLVVPFFNGKAAAHRHSPE